jgi:L-serine dehydratase
MRAARQFALALEGEGKLADVRALKVELWGSLGATGKAHGTDRAIVLGLQGEDPEHVDPDGVASRMEHLGAQGKLALLGKSEIRFVVGEHIVFHKLRSLPKHPNAMTFSTTDAGGSVIDERRYYSVGGGFVVGDAAQGDAPFLPAGEERLPYPFTTGAELLAHCAARGVSVSRLVLDNERAWHDEVALTSRLLRVWEVMQACVARGCERPGVLPGGLKVNRRAPALLRRLMDSPDASDPLGAIDWVDLWALAVSEENAAGGRVVTAPTNGAAGIIPAVLHYYKRFTRGADDQGVVRFLLVAGAIGLLYKLNASISGAEVGCQGEVGVACSMAAAGLTEVLGGTPQQVENAAEIAMEHNLGLTCDPVGGLVQVPCIERNAMGAVKAINASRIALSGDGRHRVSLDRVIATMRQTGADMLTKYKETARGGLAVSIVEC